MTLGCRRGVVVVSPLEKGQHGSPGRLEETAISARTFCKNGQQVLGASITPYTTLSSESSLEKRNVNEGLQLKEHEPCRTNSLLEISINEDEIRLTPSNSKYSSEFYLNVIKEVLL